ncbi:MULTISPECIES: hypothetical protein [Chryseobacterium]|uniref:Uncharacterized protein n=1 Tax=Chryseobacterium bernardetii TaxID=1241978 RepID=A0A3G6TYS5_9FLAO|nr:MULTISPECIES: hypothetical protein [Chryseobacterium]AZB23790.1 hypothetical protein EG339_03710 [Chryseobacterium bernardetii]AZB34385.1 hypothetical protein EG351_12660 [Chryseobacterium bernardetii]UCA58047.1 hypothetical protein KB553_13385 [Chryseobacterium rhizoplanae]
MKYLLLLLSFIPTVLWSQYLRSNEEVIYSFDTKAGKKMVLVKDKGNEYIQYRFGSKDRVEMEFPLNRNKDSWKQFKYNSYHRGGGKRNAGMDLEYLNFVNNGYTYSIFKSYYAEDGSLSTGITVTDSKGKSTDINGIYKSIKGCLCNLEDIGLVEKDDSGL